jgi:hypothetical protein
MELREPILKAKKQFINLIESGMVKDPRRLASIQKQI